MSKRHPVKLDFDDNTSNIKNNGKLGIAKEKFVTDKQYGFSAELKGKFESGGLVSFKFGNNPSIAITNTGHIKQYFVSNGGVGVKISSVKFSGKIENFCIIKETILPFDRKLYERLR